MPDDWRTCYLCGWAYQPSAVMSDGTPVHYELVARGGAYVCRNMSLCVARQLREEPKMPEKATAELRLKRWERAPYGQLVFTPEHLAWLQSGGSLEIDPDDDPIIVVGALSSKPVIHADQGRV